MCGRHMWFTQLDDYNRKEQIECNKCKNIFIRYTSHLRDELVTKPTPEELEKYKKKELKRRRHMELGKLIREYPLGCPVCGSKSWKCTSTTYYNNGMHEKQLQCNRCRTIFMRYYAHLGDRIIFDTEDIIEDILTNFKCPICGSVNGVLGAHSRHQNLITCYNCQAHTDVTLQVMIADEERKRLWKEKQ